MGAWVPPPAPWPYTCCARSARAASSANWDPTPTRPPRLLCTLCPRRQLSQLGVLLCCLGLVPISNPGSVVMGQGRGTMGSGEDSGCG